LPLRGLLLGGAALGLWPGEIMRMQGAEMDLDRNVLTVGSQGQRRTKTRRSRVVLLTDDLAEYLALLRD
jgi:hypothetical protein